MLTAANNIGLINGTITLIALGNYFKATKELLKIMTLTIIQLATFIAVVAVFATDGNPLALGEAFVILEDYYREFCAWTISIAVSKLFDW